MGVLKLRALLFGVYTSAPDFWKLPYSTAAALSSGFTRLKGAELVGPFFGEQTV